jgi:hypothetical protein
MGTMNEFFFGSEIASPKTISHLNQAISLVNQSLQTADALSNSNIAVVNFLIVRELVGEEKSTAEVHMKGLQKIVELRGGLSQLRDPLLTLKICKYVFLTVRGIDGHLILDRTDLDFSLHYGTPTCFYRDRMPEVALALASEGFFMNANLGDPRPRFSTLHASLQQILLDVNSIASHFNSDQIAFRVDPQMLQEITVSVGCRLVRFHTLAGPPLKGRCESAYHIGLAAFVGTLFLQFGRRRYLKYKLIAQSIRDVVERGLNEEDADLFMWLLFIGGVSVLAGPDKAWLVPKIHQAARSLGITTWDGVQQCLVLFPWIKALHDEAGRELWTLAMAHGSM